MTADVRLETPKQLAARVGLSERQVRHLIQTKQLDRGFRTNAEGVRQLRSLLEPSRDGRRLRPPVLHRSGGVPPSPQPDQPGRCRSCRRLSATHADRVRAEPRRRGIRLLEVPEDEFTHTQATNVPTVAPRKCIMLEGSPVTKQLLEMADCEVITFPGEPLSFKAEGGPTCLTRPGPARPGVRGMAPGGQRPESGRTRHPGGARSRGSGRVPAGADRHPESRRQGVTRADPRDCVADATPASRSTPGRSTSTSSRVIRTGATRSTREEAQGRRGLVGRDAAGRAAETGAGAGRDLLLERPHRRRPRGR